MITDTAKTPEALSLQVRLEQLEAAIQDGHGALNRVRAREDQPGDGDVPNGGLACVDRCQAEMGDLIKRLNGIADLVGTL